MKRLIFVSCTLLLAGTFNVSKAQTSQQADQQAMQKAWTDYMTPGNVHQMLAKGDGEWQAETTFWMVPGAPPTKSTAKATNKMILGGRYQETKYSGNMMGMPFEGIGVTGYDNAKKVFVSTWQDNMGTGIMYMEGKWDDASKSINFSGKVVDPMTGKDMNVREVFKFVDDNTQVMEMFMTQDGKEFKSMEMKLTKK